jgi:hypothetical protein
MEFIGNYKDWLKQEWVEEIMKSNGIAAPRDLLKGQDLHSEDKRVKDAGYNINEFYYSLFEKDNLSFSLNVPGLPLGEVRWWITKMMPGQFMPVHTDPRIGIIENIERYWMPWTDWTNGHVFVYKDTVVSNYKAGDLYMMEDPEALHGAANVGLIPRITLNIGIIKDLK